MKTATYTKAQTEALTLLHQAAATDTVYVLNEPYTCRCCFLTIHRNTVRSLAAKGLVTTREREARTIVELTDLGADASL